MVFVWYWNTMSSFGSKTFECTLETDFISEGNDMLVHFNEACFMIPPYTWDVDDPYGAR